MTNYHFTQWPNLFISLIITKIFFPSVRLIRLPIDIRNKKYMIFGQNFTTGRYNRLECYKLWKGKNPKLSIGNNVQINDKCHFACVNEIIIQDDCLIASNVFITDHDHANLKTDIDFSIPWSNQFQYSSKVYISRNVWIGENVIILKGVNIGSNSVIAAGSVVNKSFPERSVIAGNPAKLIRRL